MRACIEPTANCECLTPCPIVGPDPQRALDDHEPPSDWPSSARISLHRREAMPQDNVATVENFWREVWKQRRTPTLSIT